MCQDDSCDQVHCGRCGCHTVGNQLLGGLCWDCFQLEEELEEERRAVLACEHCGTPLELHTAGEGTVMTCPKCG